MEETTQEEHTGIEDSGEELEPVDLETGPILSQRDYVPTAYKASTWEFVGERVKENDFTPIRLPIFRDEQAQADPMFEDFTVPGSVGDTEQWHTESGKYSKVEAKQNKEEAERQSQLHVEEQLAEKYKEGHEAGYQEGYQVAGAEIRAQQEDLSSKIEEFTRQVGNEKAELFSRIEKTAVEFSLQIAKKILSTTAEARPEYIVDVIRQAVEALGAAKPLKIRVSEQDFEFVSVVGLPPELSREELGVEYVADEGIKSGCVVETDFGELDLQLDKMWEQVNEQLYEVYKK